jgi:hypothetical protein
MDELAGILKLVASALDRLGIPFAVGGSVASSVRGVMRATYDIDIVAGMGPEMALQLADALGPEWYADPEEMRTALLDGRPFNVIYVPAAYKVDIFPATEPFHLTEIERATLADFAPDVSVPVASPEDCLLAKLCWYRDGGEISDRQWSDISGIVATSPALDRSHLELWAARLGVTSLLERVLAAGPEAAR